MFFHVSAARLHEIVLVDPYGNETVVSIFPYFNRSGVVELLLIVDAQQGMAYIVDDQTEIKPSLKSVALAYPLYKARVMRVGALPEFEGLYHYDPWWVLVHPLFQIKTWVPVLKATNCASGFREPVQEIYFNRKLQKLSALVFENQDVSVRYSPKYMEMNSTLIRVENQRSESTQRGIAYVLKKGGWRLREIAFLPNRELASPPGKKAHRSRPWKNLLP